MCVEGVRSRRIDPRQVARVLEGMVRARFPAFVHETNLDAHDAPGISLAVDTSGHRHAIEVRNTFSVANDVRLVASMANRIDEIAGTREWVGVDAGWNRFCISSNGEVTRPL